MALLAIPFGLAIGLAVGALGGGGSVLAIPVLVYVLGESVHEATTTSLVVVAVAAVAGGIGHTRSGYVCWRHFAVLAPLAMVGVFAGTVANRAAGGDLLLGLFAVLMLAAAWAIWRSADTGGAGASTSQGGCPPLRAVPTAFAGLVVGLLTGFFGVGGGFVVVPILGIALGFPIRNAIGTSLVVVSGVAAVGIAAHVVSGAGLDVQVTATMTAACAAGAIGGATLAPRISHQTLGRSFALLLGLVAAYLLIETAFLGGPPQS